MVLFAPPTVTQPSNSVTTTVQPTSVASQPQQIGRMEGKLPLTPCPFDSPDSPPTGFRAQPVDTGMDSFGNLVSSLTATDPDFVVKDSQYCVVFSETANNSGTLKNTSFLCSSNGSAMNCPWNNEDKQRLNIDYIGRTSKGKVYWHYVDGSAKNCGQPITPFIEIVCSPEGAGGYRLIPQKN